MNDIIKSVENFLMTLEIFFISLLNKDYGYYFFFCQMRFIPCKFEYIWAPLVQNLHSLSVERGNPYGFTICHYVHVYVLTLICIDFYYLI